MCTVSMIGDFYQEKWAPPLNAPFVLPAPVTAEEFAALKREVEDMKALLLRAKRYDEEHGEPDCEIDEKVAVLRRVAKMVGVDLADVFEPEEESS